MLMASFDGIIELNKNLPDSYRVFHKAQVPQWLGIAADCVSLDKSRAKQAFEMAAAYQCLFLGDLR